MNKTMYGIVALVLLSAVSAQTLVGIGTVTSTGTITGVPGGPDCLKGTDPNNPPSPMNFFLGENVSANLDPNDPTNAPLIALTNGPNIRANEFCFGNDLVEPACSDAYTAFGIPSNLFAAFQFTPSQVATFSGLSSSTNLVCQEWMGSSNIGQPPFRTYAFMAYPAPAPFVLVSPSNPAGPFITGGTIIGGIINAAAWPAAGQSLTNLYVTAMPNNNIVGVPVACPPTGICSLGAGIPVSCPGTYHIIVQQGSNNIQSVKDVAC